MIDTTLKIRGTNRAMRKLLRDLPAVVSGRKPDVHGYGRLFKSYFAYFWFEKVHEAFLIKSLGGTDSMGVSWEPNAQSTIAQREIGPKDSRKIRGKTSDPIESRVRGLLTPAQDALWRGIFRTNYLRLLGKVGETEAKARAATIAWAMLKKMGAQTKLEVLGSRKLPIGNDTGRLLNSISPGRVVGNTYIPPTRDQSISYHHGELDFNIKVPYARRFHKKRRIWPAASRSGEWVKEAATKALNEVAKEIGSDKKR